VQSEYNETFFFIVLFTSREYAKNVYTSVVDLEKAYDRASDVGAGMQGVQAHPQKF